MQISFTESETTLHLGSLSFTVTCVRDVQDLQLALETARSALQEREEQRREAEGERERQDEERERTIRELRTSLLTKEQLVEVRQLKTTIL